MKRFLLNLMAFAAIILFAAPAADAQKYIYPKAGENWQKAKPSKYGFEGRPG